MAQYQHKQQEIRIRQFKREAAIVAASKFIKKGNIVFVGQGLPVITSLFAKRTHAKDSVIINEYGIVDTDPPFAVELAHPLLAESALYLCDMIDALGCLIYEIDIALLGAAQVDRFGNVNTTTIGDYFHPKVRISGSGGANDIGSLAPKFLIVMDNQSPSKMPRNVDYNTTPGFFFGSRKRRNQLGLIGGGPIALVTDLGLYKFLEETGEMYLEAVHYGVSIEQVRANTGWKIRLSPKVGVIPPPTKGELDLLQSIDPRKVYLR
jgi:glutaconate CoA-transferase subunit B